MSDLISLFTKLSEFYAKDLQWEHVEELYEKDNERKSKPSSAAAAEPASAATEPATGRAAIASSYGSVAELPLVQAALKDAQVLSTLLELSSTIRSLRSENSAYDATDDCWEQVLKVSPRTEYLAFVYALAGLANLDAANASYTKLALAAVNTYFLSLTIPGAKGFHIFDEDVIAHCLQVFALVERLQNPDLLQRMPKQQSIEIWVRVSTFCDNWKLLLRYVHFSDNKATRDAMLKRLIKIHYLNFERGYANLYAVNLHKNCFEIFEELLHPHNGDPEETLLKLMNMTVYLHTFPPKPKNLTPGSSQLPVVECEHISDWFIKCIAKYPRLVVKLLRFYIECVVTNPIKSWKTEQIQRALDYAAKYDAALFSKCNESCVEFLCEAAYADEATIRGRALDLMARILQLESHVDWQMFRHEVSNIPRELHLIKELIISLQDASNTIKLKAVQALHAALTKGSPTTQKIMRECLRFAEFNDEAVLLPEEPRIRKNEIRFEKPAAVKPHYTFEGAGLCELEFLHLPEYVYGQLFHSPLSYIRRSGVLFMEQLAKLNPLIIFNTKFVSETSSLVNEPVALVRKQTLLSIDAILTAYPNCFPVIWVWCKILTPMLRDSDAKNVELAMDCFRSKVLLNLKGIDQSNRAEHFMPWVIIRTILSTQSRLYLQTCFHQALQQRMVNDVMITIIESHLVTSNSIEAWVVLNFVTGSKAKCREPDSLIQLFTSLESWNKEQNMLIALEVLANCINDFSHTGLNYAFTHILGGIREGTMLPAFIGKAFDFLLLIDNRSNAKVAAGTGPLQDKPWVLELHDHLEFSILTGLPDFPDNRATFMSFLYSYSEVNLQTRRRPLATIVAFVHKYLSTCLKLADAELDSENQRVLNSMIVVAGRLSLRDPCIARTTCTLFGMILQAVDRPPIVNTIIIAVTDLCKKHTQLVEGIIEHVLRKLASPFAVNRTETFKCFEKLVLQDQLKLRGSLLLALLAAILDECAELATRACDFFAEFLAKKSPTLFQKCLIECPFVLNEYKNFDGLDSFQESSIKSPLKGDSKRKQRHLLYNHFMSDMQDINLILYFGQLKLIAEKSQQDPLIKSPEGLALIKDVLFILRRICQETKEQKTASDADNNKEDDLADELAEPAAGGKEGSATPAAQAAAVAVIGRGRRRREVTMTEALNILEKSLAFVPTIYEHLRQHDPSLQKYFDDLGRALSQRFPTLIDYAQPAEFWNKYRKSKIQAVSSASAAAAASGSGSGSAATSKKKRAPKKRKSSSRTNTSKNEDEFEDDGDGDNDNHHDDSPSDESAFSSDDELPLNNVRAASKPKVPPTQPPPPPSLAKRMRSVNCTELQMEYLFNPNI